MLMRSMKKKSFRDPSTGELSTEAARQFESEITQFVKELPREFALDFRMGQIPPTPAHHSTPRAMDEGSATSPFAHPTQPTMVSSPFGMNVSSPYGAQTPQARTPEDSTMLRDFTVQTSFPVSDIVAAQACELRSMANTLILQLWSPFLRPSHARTQPNQPASLASATAAHGIIVAAHHLLNRFRFVRPAAYGFYGFGQMVWHSGLVLASVVINSPEVLFADNALKGLEVAIEVMKDPIVAGLGMRKVARAGGQPGQRSQQIQPKLSQATAILEMMKSTAESTFAGTGTGFGLGSKRKNGEASVSMRALGTNGFQLPYAGGAVLSGPIVGDSELNGTGGAGAPDSMTSPPQRGPQHSSTPAGHVFWTTGADHEATSGLVASSSTSAAFQMDHQNGMRSRAQSVISTNSSSIISSAIPSKSNAAYPLLGVRDRSKNSVKVETSSATGIPTSSAGPTRTNGSQRTRDGASGKVRKRTSNSSIGRGYQTPAGPTPASAHVRRPSTQSQFPPPQSGGPSSLPPPPPPPASMQDTSQVGMSYPVQPEMAYPHSASTPHFPAQMEYHDSNGYAQPTPQPQPLHQSLPQSVPHHHTPQADYNPEYPQSFGSATQAMMDGTYATPVPTEYAQPSNPGVNGAYTSYIPMGMDMSYTGYATSPTNSVPPGMGINYGDGSGGDHSRTPSSMGTHMPRHNGIHYETVQPTQSHQEYDGTAQQQWQQMHTPVDSSHQWNGMSYQT